MRNRIVTALILSLFAVRGVCARELTRQERTEVGRTLTRIVSREVAGGYVKVTGAKVSRGRVRIETSIGLSYYPFREQNVRAMYDSVRAVLPREFRKARIELVTDRREIGELIPFACRDAARMRRAVRFTNRSERPLVEPLSRLRTPQRGLAGRHIALWQSHGRYFDQKQNRWRWQRSCLWQTCEDLYTQSYVLPYVVPMLENAGACVLLPRERDVQKTEIVVDGDPGVDRGTRYVETDGAERWSDGGTGFAHLRSTYSDAANPFAQGRSRMVRSVAGGEESRAEWRADIPETDDYAVYVSYRSTLESVDDACYTVRHAGGESRFAVNQRMGGGTWIYLGTFRLRRGTEVPVVVLSNRSARAGRVVSADAVKIGGGYGNIARTVCASLRTPDGSYPTETSGYPRFCEGARYWLQWAGFDEEVYSPKRGTDDYKDDYMARAHWVNALAGGSERLPDAPGLAIPLDMAFAFHSDAGVRDNDETVGTLGIFYTRENGGRFSGGADRYRSRDLTDLVMTQLVEDIRRTYEPAWSRRGLWNRAYYEARVPAVPTMLLELLSHQNFADMRYGSDPRFKFLAGRAVYKGILKYLASQYDVPYVVQPLPVEAPAVRFAGDDRVTITWSPVLDSLEATAVPTGYVVYTRVDDGGFDNGRYTEVPSLTVAQEPGRIYSYRVTALNEGGESFPSEILAACRMPSSRGEVLVVNGFDRICGPESERSDTTAGFRSAEACGVPYLRDISYIGPQRVFDAAQARAENDSVALGACGRDYETEVVGGNTFDYPYVHGRSIAAAGYSFCSASAHAVERGEIAPEDFAAVDLVLGKQRATTLGPAQSERAFRAFPAELQAALRRYAAAGGALFVSGSYVGSDLWDGGRASESDLAFAREVLHFDFDGGAAASQGRVRVVGSHPAFSRGDYRFEQRMAPACCAVEAPDALKPCGPGAFGVMRYVENGRPAGVACEEGRSFVLGFPFESVRDAAQRDRLMRDALVFLLER